jgi:ribosomal protein S18 acetylase RimI-like enzyme
MTATIRRARREDADFIAWNILASQRGHRPRGWFDIALDRIEPECLAFVHKLSAVQTRSWWHASRFWVAEVDGIAAAALCAMPAAEARGASQPAIAEAAAAAGFDAAELEAIWRRGAYTRSCWIMGDDESWLIEHVATREAHRGQGLVQTLLAHAFASGAAAGFRRASISFLIGNEAAQRCYAKAGFSFAEEKRDAKFEALTGAAGFRRFERAI